MPVPDSDLNDGELTEPTDGSTDYASDETQDDYAEGDEAEDVTEVGDESADDAAAPEAQEPPARKATPLDIPDLATPEEEAELETEIGTNARDIIARMVQRGVQQALAAQDALESGMTQMGVPREYLDEFGNEVRQYSQSIRPQDRHKPEAVVAAVLGGLGMRILNSRDENGNVDIGAELRKAAAAFDRQQQGPARKPPVPPRRTEGQLRERGTRPAQVAAPSTAQPIRRGGDREAEALAKRMGITVEQARAAVNVARHGGR